MKENNSSINNFRYVIRGATRALTGSTVFRSERIIEPGTNGLSDFEEKISEGYGGVIIMKHFSLKDPPQAIRDIVFSTPTLIRKRVLAPNAQHQIYPGVKMMGRIMGVKIAPIVTENTVKKALKRGKPTPTLNEGSVEFVREAVDYLRQGQLVVIAPEGERRDNLEPYTKPTIGLLVAGAQRDGVNEIMFLTVDLRVAGSDYSRRGFNLLSRYEVRVGRALSLDQMMELAGGSLRKIDSAVLEEMRQTAAIPKPNRG